MDQVKSLAKQCLSEEQVRVLRRLVHGWRQWRDGRSRVDYTVGDLRNASRQLWAGHSATAEKLLRRVLNTPEAPKSDKARAAFQLARLHASKMEWAETDALLDTGTLRRLKGLDAARGHVLKATAAMELGRFEIARQSINHRSMDRIGRNQKRLLHANLEYYQARHAGKAPEIVADLRLELVNRMYRDAGLMEIRKKDANRPLGLDNIEPRDADPAPRDEDVKVSVLVPCFNAQDTIRFALDSILEQTHRDVEVLCVDDRSEDDTRAIVGSYVETGAPVTLLVNERNSGPYYGRNRALQQASGDFVTVQDADDWMHPQRIEVQLARLRAHPDVKFSFTRLARVAEGFLFTLRPFRPMLEPIHWSYTSIMGARDTFLELGGWDPVVAHADAEFIDRVKDRLGEEALGECYVDVPMALFTDGAGNLTKRSGTGLTSVGFGARREYQEQARVWRQQGANGLPERGVIDRDSGRFPFFVPNALLPAHLKRDTRYDFIFVTDMSLLGGTRRCNLEYFRICVERGWKVGVFNYPRYRGRWAGSIDEEYRRLFDRGDIDLLTPEDSVESGALIVHHPPILDMPIDRYPEVRTSNVALLVNQLPYQSTRPDAPALYDIRQVEVDLEREFGSPPVWIPISGLVRDRLEQFVGTERIWADIWYPVAENGLRAGFHIDREQPASGRPIRVGRHSRDDATKWPETTEDLRRVYPRAGDIEVHILGGADMVCGGKARIPSHWVVHPFDSMDVVEFLNGLDVFIHWTRSDYVEEFGRNVAEAMARGVPCILSRDLEPTFGDAALYPSAEEVESTIRALTSDTDLRRSLVEKGRDFVRRNCSAVVAGDRMGRLLARQAVPSSRDCGPGSSGPHGPARQGASAS